MAENSKRVQYRVVAAVVNLGKLDLVKRSDSLDDFDPVRERERNRLLLLLKPNCLPDPLREVSAGSSGSSGSAKVVASVVSRDL